LYEAYLLKLAFQNMRTVLRSKPSAIAEKLERIVSTNASLRMQMISIGIPILLSDGKTLLRGNEIKIHPFQGENELPISRKAIDNWANDGWVDLRSANMERWKLRFGKIRSMVDEIPAGETSSRHMNNLEYWDHFEAIDPGKLAGWIFSYEEEGMRMKA